MTVHHILIGAATLALAVAAILLYPRSDHPAVVIPPRERAVPQPVREEPAAEAVPAPMQDRSPNNAKQEAAAPVWNASFVELVSKKYRYLLADVRDSADRAKLLKLLLERENLVAALPESRARLAQLEREIQALLTAAQLTTFELLKESDNEQHHMLEYAGGISNFAPLTPAQERAVLEAKLRHKRHFEAVLRDAGIDRETLSFAEREYAHTVVQQAVQAYKTGFLMDVRPILNEEQYMLLSNYETTEFDRELQRLQIAINSK
jgi:cell division septum initiation protein DivIVA